MTHEDTSKVRAVLDRFATGWRTGDAELLKSLWDADYPDGSYIASERDCALFGMAAINDYDDETLAAFDYQHGHR